MATQSTDNKHAYRAQQPVEEALGEVEVIDGDTRQDQLDMLRLGKKQMFRRNFSFISTLGFISIYMVSDESTGPRMIDLLPSSTWDYHSMCPPNIRFANMGMPFSIGFGTDPPPRQPGNLS